MTDGKRGNGTELGKRLYDMFSRSDRERGAGSGTEFDVFSKWTVTGGITHEEALLLLAAPEDIEELIRKKEASGKDQSSFMRLLQWSDSKRKLKVLARAETSDQADAGMRRGAQGIGLLRGEAMLHANVLLHEIYRDWLDSQDEIEKLYYRTRLVSLWTEEGTAIIQAARGALCSVSLAWDKAVECSPEARYELQDIQLESWYRALARCQEEGTECRLELLAFWPADAADFTAAYEFMDEVGKQTLCQLKPTVELRIGALLHPEIAPDDAADIARLADVIVMDTEYDLTHQVSENRDNPRAIRGGIDLTKEITEWANPVLLQYNIEEVISGIRRVKPHIGIRVSGEVTAADLHTIYRLGISEVCCEAGSIAPVRLAGVRLEWMFNRLSAAEEA
ncbi:putative PEP-binding protein [Paenibacillus dakarensis]|uniref:putative PEP-binding protein n=1 Tax=Paenibacillus dakarensis TaxID=1527293 RepID=UPI0006D5AAA3|nr:putative PEP-binding protein [Paenibacillus dakarensis]